MPTSPIVQGFLAFAVLTCLFALVKGSWAERSAALLIIVNTAIYSGGILIPQSLIGVTYLMADAIAAVGMLVITLRYGSPWLGLAMLLYAAQFGLHAYYLVLEKAPTDRFHIVYNNLNSLGILLCLLLGTWSSVHRRSKARKAAQTA